MRGHLTDSTGEEVSSPRVGHAAKYTHMQAWINTYARIQNHQSAAHPPVPTQQTRRYIQRDAESVPSEIHRILLGESAIGDSPVPVPQWLPAAFGFRDGGRGPTRTILRPTPGVRGRRVEIVVEAAEAFVHALVVALVGGGVHLVLPGRDLQGAVPHAVAKVNQHACGNTQSHLYKGGRSLEF